MLVPVVLEFRPEMANLISASALLALLDPFLRAPAPDSTLILVSLPVMPSSFSASVMKVLLVEATIAQ